MAKGKQKPSHAIFFSAKVGEKKYVKGPVTGLFKAEDDGGPLFRATIKGEYLEKLAKFLKTAAAKDYPVGVAVFKSKFGAANGKKKSEEDDDGFPSEAEENEDEFKL